MEKTFMCYACGGDYTAGIEVEGVFYCTRCAIQTDRHNSPEAKDVGEVVIYQAWLHDGLMREGVTETEAIEAAVAEYESTIGYGSEDHLFANRDVLVAALDVSVRTTL